MSLGLLHGIWSTFILLVFVGIVGFVWRKSRRAYYEEAGRIPFDGERDHE
jgi:cbb3-type cytochrome oxidase subunit 3